MAPIGWLLDLSSGEDYFENERLETAAWDAVRAADSAGVKAEKALLNAFNRLYYDPAYPLLPDGYASASAAQRVILRKAQSEMAYYLCVHLADEDRRKGLQAQGVIKAGIVQEDYYADWLAKLPVPPFVDSLLAEFKDVHHIFASDIERDENKSAKEKVHDF